LNAKSFVVVAGLLAFILLCLNVASSDAKRIIGDCLNVCKGELDTTKSCVGEANSCLDLECSFTAYNWYWRPQEQNVSLGSFIESKDPSSYFIDSDEINFSRLQIIKLKSNDHGQSAFSAQQRPPRSKRCLFNVLVYGI
jgi:hypothetical protein